MRLVAWNVETLRGRSAALPEVAAALGDFDVLCLQELGLRAQDRDEVAALERALPGYVCHHALPRDPHNVTYRGGRAYGVATFVRVDGRAAVPDFDREGRCIVVQQGDVAIGNVYAVNGTAKPYFDEAGRPSGDRHAFKRRFQRAVLALGADLGPTILAGDWNVSRTALDTHPRLRSEAPHARARAELNELLDEFDFVDIWRALHPEERGYTWFNPRARSLDAARVDYILVRRSLVPRVVAASILPRQRWSDHAPIDLTLA